MNETLRTAAISPLRQRMIDDMNVRRFSRETQRNYIRDVGRFADADDEQHRVGVAVLLHTDHRSA
jgi:hypothetical protein